MNRGIKILLISHYDFAGSGHRMAEAVNLYTTNQVLPIIFLDISYPKAMPRMPALIANYSGQNVVSAPSLDRLQALIDDADIIHFKGDDLPSRNPLGDLKIPEDKPIALTVNGSFFRRGGAKSVSMGEVPLEDYVVSADYRSAGDPSLLYEAYGGHWTPMPIDLSKFPQHDHKWTETFKVAHSPSDLGKKGTSKIKRAILALRKKGCDVELDVIKDVSYMEAVERKRQASLFFDQTEAGFYGNAGLEAMAFGIPTMTYLTHRVHTHAPDTVCMDSGTTVKEITENLSLAYSKYQDKKAWSALSEKTHRYIEKVHGYEAVAVKWEIIYKSLLSL